MPKTKKSLCQFAVIPLMLCCLLQISRCRHANSSPGEHTYVKLEGLKADSAPFGKTMVSTLFKESYSRKGDNSDSERISLFKVALVFEPVLKSNAVSKGPNDSISVQVTQQRDRIRYTIDKNNDGVFNEPYLNQTEEHGWNEIRNVSLPIADKRFSTSYFLMKVKPTLQIIGSSHKNSLPKGEEFAAMPIFRHGVFTTKDSAQYHFALFNYFANRYMKELSELVIVPSGNEFPLMEAYPVRYRVGDTIYLNKYAYRYSNVSVAGDSIDLQYITELAKNYGVNSGTYAFPTKFNNVVNGSPGFIGKTGRYTLLDFWGTWCGPCLALTPYLKDLHAQSRRNVDFIGIAYDDDKADVRDYVESHSINWPTAFDDRKRSEICRKYQIKAFPTLILIDPEGKIVVRSTGPKTRVEIEEYIKSHNL